VRIFALPGGDQDEADHRSNGDGNANAGQGQAPPMMVDRGLLGG
jgi:hypothetical protein